MSRRFVHRQSCHLGHHRYLIQAFSKVLCPKHFLPRFPAYGVPLVYQHQLRQPPSLYEYRFAVQHSANRCRPHVWYSLSCQYTRRLAFALSQHQEQSFHHYLSVQAASFLPVSLLTHLARFRHLHPSQRPQHALRFVSLPKSPRPSSLREQIILVCYP